MEFLYLNLSDSNTDYIAAGAVQTKFIDKKAIIKSLQDDYASKGKPEKQEMTKLTTKTMTAKCSFHWVKCQIMLVH